MCESFGADDRNRMSPSKAALGWFHTKDDKSEFRINCWLDQMSAKRTSYNELRKLNTNVRNPADCLGHGTASMIRELLMDNNGEEAFGEEASERDESLRKFVNFQCKAGVEEEELILLRTMPFEYQMKPSEAERFLSYLSSPSVSLSMLLEFTSDQV